MKGLGDKRPACNASSNKENTSKMSKAFRHSGVLMVVATVALGLLGAAYTLWFENLSLTATVSTGTFNVDWSIEQQPLAVVSTDLGETYRPFSAAEALKVTQCTASIATNNTTGQANDAADNNVLNVTAANLYPYAGCEFWIDIHSMGSVPAHVAMTALTGLGPDYALYPGCYPAETCEASRAFTITVLNAAGDPARPSCERLAYGLGIDGSFTPANLGTQLHSGEKLVCGLRFALKQVPNVEGMSFSWRMDLKAHQWNETVLP